MKQKLQANTNITKWRYKVNVFVTITKSWWHT